jgi:hypothetical protein
LELTTIEPPEVNTCNSLDYLRYRSNKESKKRINPRSPKPFDLVYTGNFVFSSRPPHQKREERDLKIGCVAALRRALGSGLLRSRRLALSDS